MKGGLLERGLIRAFTVTMFCFSLQALVWDDKLTGPFGLVAEYTLLKVRKQELEQC